MNNAFGGGFRKASGGFEKSGFDFVRFFLFEGRLHPRAFWCSRAGCSLDINGAARPGDVR